MIKLDIINEVVNKTGITKTKAEMAVETVFESMKKALEQGDRIELRGFGVFNVKPRKTGIGRNPRTGAEVSIPPARPCASSPARSCRRCSRVCCAPQSIVSPQDFSPAPYPASAENGTGGAHVSVPRPHPRALLAARSAVCADA